MNHKYFFRVVTATVVTLSTFCSPNSSSAKMVTCTNCSTIFTQMIEQIQGSEQLAALYEQVSESVIQTEQQIQIVYNTLKQYENMVQNTMRLPADAINGVKGKLSNLAQQTSQLATLRGEMSALGQIFNELYPGKEMFEGFAKASTPQEIAAAAAKYKGHVDTWSKKVDQAAQATFQLSGQQLRDLQDTGEFEGYLDGLLSTPTGQMQAIMAGNNLAALQIQEARQLRELLATTTQSQLQSQMKAEKEEQLFREEWGSVTQVENLKSLVPKQDPF